MVTTQAPVLLDTDTLSAIFLRRNPMPAHRCRVNQCYAVSRSCPGQDETGKNADLTYPQLSRMVLAMEADEVHNKV